MNNDLPPPYSMCCEEECRERQAQNQVSAFEATSATCNAALITQRILDPQLAITKYRRSAAGNIARNPPRTLPQMLISWKRICDIFLYQKSCPTMTVQSLRTTVAFCDDRIRAIQVDLVLSQEAYSSLQIQLIRYQLVCCYLLSEIPRKAYEPKFARQALWTALTGYWNGAKRQNENDDDDQVLAYTTLCHLATRLLQEQGIANAGWQDSSSTSSYGNILLLASQHAAASENKYPRFQFALQVVSTAMLGFSRNVLDMLLCSSDEEDESCFRTLCKVCMAPAFNVLRLDALRQYNKAFGKRELISGKEMARLLFLPDANAALEFCASVGLPVEDGAVAMKAAPVSVATPATTLAWSRMEDALVFGTDWKEGDDSVRVDDEGVLIPPPFFLKSLITSSNE